MDDKTPPSGTAEVETHRQRLSELEQVIIEAYQARSFKKLRVGLDDLRKFLRSSRQQVELDQGVFGLIYDLLKSKANLIEVEKLRSSLLESARNLLRQMALRPELAQQCLARGFIPIMVKLMLEENDEYMAGILHIMCEVYPNVTNAILTEIQAPAIVARMMDETLDTQEREKAAEDAHILFSRIGYEGLLVTEICVPLMRAASECLQSEKTPPGLHYKCLEMIESLCRCVPEQSMLIPALNCVALLAVQPLMRCLDKENMDRSQAALVLRKICKYCDRALFFDQFLDDQTIQFLTSFLVQDSDRNCLHLTCEVLEIILDSNNNTATRRVLAKDSVWEAIIQTIVADACIKLIRERCLRLLNKSVEKSTRDEIDRQMTRLPIIQALFMPGVWDGLTRYADSMGSLTHLFEQLTIRACLKQIRDIPSPALCEGKLDSLLVLAYRPGLAHGRHRFPIEDAMVLSCASGSSTYKQGIFRDRKWGVCGERSRNLEIITMLVFALSINGAGVRPTSEDDLPCTLRLPGDLWRLVMTAVYE